MLASVALASLALGGCAERARVPGEASAPVAGGRVAPGSATRAPEAQSATDLRRAERRGPLTATPAAGADDEPADRRTSERIRRELAKDPALRDVALDRIRVTTKDGKVTLNGLVPTTADKVEIETKARSIKGVEKVDNQLEELR